MAVPSLPLLSRRGLLGALAGAAGATPDGLRIGGFEVAPLVLAGRDAHQAIDGALPAFIRRKVEPQLGFALRWQRLLTFGRGLQSLRDGSLDLLMPFSGDRTLSSGIGRFAWTMLRAAPQLAVRGDSPLREGLGLASLAGLEIGWVAHSRLPRELEDLPIRWRRLSTQHWQAVGLRMLQARRLDAVYFANSYSAVYYAKREGLALRLLPLPMPSRPLTMAHSLQADARQLARFDAVAAAAFDGGRFERFLAGYTG